MTDIEFAEQLAETIGDISDWPADPDFATMLAMLTERLATTLQDGGIEERKALELAATAVEEACLRDGIKDEARRAMRSADAEWGR